MYDFDKLVKINDLIEECTLTTSGIGFTGNDFRTLCGPIVYGFMLRGMLRGMPLYIGASTDGLGRPGSRNHHKAETARATCDEVRIWPCKGKKEALRLERFMISYLRPILNRTGKNQLSRMVLGLERGRTKPDAIHRTHPRDI